MLQKKCILIINQYASTPETAIGGRHYYLAQEFAKLGYQVYVVSSAFTHLLRNPKKINDEFFIETITNNLNFIWVRLPRYENAHSKQRIINEFLFSWKIRKIKKIIEIKPDIVYHSAPAVLSYYGAKYLADHYSVPYVFEERDIWPLTLVELGGYSTNHPFIKLLQFTQDKAYYHAKFVLSNLYNAVEHLELRGGNINKFHWVPNGVSLDELNAKEELSKEVYDKIPKDKFIVGYTGTLGIANAVDSLILTAHQLMDYKDIYFVLVGAGKQKEELIQLCKEKQVTNVLFIDSIPKKQVQSILELFDICFVGSQFSPLYRFGASPNKVPEYLYAKKPILYTISDTDNIVKQAYAGICVGSNNIDKMKDAILELYNLDENKRVHMGENGRKFVLENLDYKILAQKVLGIFFGEKVK